VDAGVEKLCIVDCALQVASLSPVFTRITGFFRNLTHISTISPVSA